MMRTHELPAPLPPYREKKTGPRGLVSLARARWGGGGLPPGTTLLLGPPGTGKTEQLLRRIETAIADGIPLSQIGIFTFTRAARAEVVARLRRLTTDESTWVRTLHSACFRLLGVSRDDLLDPTQCRTGLADHGFCISDPSGVSLDDPLARRIATSDDELLAAYDWGRARGLDIEVTAAQYPGYLDVPRLRSLARSYANIKHDKLDYTDLLIETIERGLSPDLPVLAIDEAQDLSPLQAQLVQLWSENAEHIFIAGDDDQTVYGFQGADPTWLLGLAAVARTTILTQSHRVPRRVHALAQSIIQQNTKRIPKEYAPADREGSVQHLSLPAALDLAAEGVDALVLARSWDKLSRTRRYLLDTGIPFIERGRDHAGTYGSTSPALLRAAQAIAAGDLPDLSAFAWSGLARLCGFRWLGDRDRDRVVQRLQGGGGGFLEALASLSATRRRNLQRVLHRNRTFPDPTMGLGTIHGTKGREAHTVILIPDLARRCHDALYQGTQEQREAERRVLYVSLTRASERLVIAHPHGRRHYQI